MDKKLWATIAFFAFLFWFWPNFVHEPLHLSALWLQGSDGTINFDLSYPSTPSVTRTEPVKGIAGGLFFVLLPSIVNVIVLLWILLTRNRAGLLTHIALPMYLVADLFINVTRHTHATSDFHFLTVLNPFISLALSTSILILGGLVFASVMKPVAKNKTLIPLRKVCVVGGQCI